MIVLMVVLWLLRTRISLRIWSTSCRILWFDNASKQTKAKDWNEQLQEVMAFESVEEFWGLYNK